MLHLLRDPATKTYCVLVGPLVVARAAGEQPVLGVPHRPIDKGKLFDAETEPYPASLCHLVAMSQ